MSKKKFFTRNVIISRVLLDNFKVYLSVFTKGIVIFSHILPPDSQTLNRP